MKKIRNLEGRAGLIVSQKKKALGSGYGKCGAELLGFCWEFP
jgi:hypothetical protein